MDKVYILAGSKQQALHFAEINNLPTDKVRYIYNSRGLCGVKGTGKSIFVVGTADSMDNYDEIIDVALSRGFKIVETRRD